MTNLPGTMDTVTELTYNKDSTAATGVSQDKQLPEATDVATEMAANRKAHKHVLAPGEDLFKSLFAAEKTPPTTPGSVASSGTLIDPSSRKVSPLDLESLGKDTPTAVKDFAYPSPDSVRTDPVAVIEEATKRGLLKEVKKMIAAGKKASRKAENLVARTKTLSAELKSATAAVENVVAQADLAKVLANAMTVSNVVLRQMIKDMSEGEAKLDQKKDEVLQEHLRGVGESNASAYGRMTILENASGVRGQDLDTTSSRKSVAQEQPSPTNEAVESKESESSINTLPTQQAPEEPQTDVVVSASVTGASEETQPETIAQASEVPPKETTGDSFDKYGPDPAKFARLVSSVTPTANQDSEEKDSEEVTLEKEAIQEVNEHEVDPMADNVVLTALQQYQQLHLNLGQESAAGRSQEMVDPIATHFEDATPEQDNPSEVDGEDQVSEADEDTSPSAAEHLNLESARDEEPVVQDLISDAIRNDDQVQAVDEGHEVRTYDNYEFSEPAGPATLWGILQSDHNNNNATEFANASDEAASVSQPAGPAAIEDATLQSDQTENNANDLADTHDDAAGVLEPPGPATLWGILQSSQKEDVAEDGADAMDATAGMAEAAGPTTQSVLSEANDNPIAGDEIAGAPETVGPALSWGIIRSDQGENVVEEAAVEEAASTSTSSTTPRPPLPYLVEKIDFIGPVPKPKEINKTEKRRQERKRAAAKKYEEMKVRL